MKFSNLQVKPSVLIGEHRALQIMTFFTFFLFFRISFSFCPPGSGFTQPNSMRIQNSVKNKNISRLQWKGYKTKTCATKKTDHQNTANHRICPYMLTKH